VIHYEVELEVERAIAEDYLRWLRPHMAEILALPGFLGAELLEEDAGPDEARRFCVRYRLRDHAALERYLREDAPRLREDGLRRFGTRFTARRRVLRPPGAA
jgi:quinol monooxygenase YgiN